MLAQLVGHSIWAHIIEKMQRENNKINVHFETN